MDEITLIIPFQQAQQQTRIDLKPLHSAANLSNQDIMWHKKVLLYFCWWSSHLPSVGSSLLVFVCFWFFGDFFFKKPSKARLRSCRNDVSHPCLWLHRHSPLHSQGQPRLQLWDSAWSCWRTQQGQITSSKSLPTRQKASNEHHFYHCVNQGQTLMDQLGYNGLFEIFDLYSEVYKIDEITSCYNNWAYYASFLHFMGSLGFFYYYLLYLSSKQQGSFSKVGVNVIMSFGSSSQLLFRVTD